MKPAKLDLPTIWRGCDYGPIILNWKDANGLVFNLAGWVPIAWTSGFTLAALVTQADQGITQIALTNEITSTLKLGVYQWNWVWENIGTTSFIYAPTLAGTVEVKNPITPL